MSYDPIVNQVSSAESSDHPSEAQVLLRLHRRDILEARRLLSLISSADHRLFEDTANRRCHPVSAQQLIRRAQEILTHRRRRQQIFGRAMFSEPAWEILLSLYLLDTHARQTISRLALMVDASKSTALRWIEYLEAQHWVHKESHPTDARASFVRLTAKGRDAIELYLSDTLAARE